MFETFLSKPKYEVITPVQVLSWADLERLRKNKKKTPFSGTTVTVDSRGRALWFSKTILPAIRDEENLRAAGPLSPVRQHLGLYGFRADILENSAPCRWASMNSLRGWSNCGCLKTGSPCKPLKSTCPRVRCRRD